MSLRAKPIAPHLRAEDLVGAEWAEWFRLTPAERWRESQKLWASFVALGGSLDPEPDTQSPFFDARAPRESAADGRAGCRWEELQQVATRITCTGVKLRFYIDPETGEPHVFNHNVDEQEVNEVLETAGEDRPGREESRVAIGKTFAGRYLRVIYVPDPEPYSVFVITAYELKGKPLAAYRARRKKKRRR